ncbi:MAG: hypothetical protein JWM10_4361, partial [Myxococcaceae bacterium]|nr:hypothetical protein [Myxococcaceae bacterium]
TACYDARYVTGVRLRQRFTGDHPAVAGTAGARVFAWRVADGVMAWWEGMDAPVRVVEGPVTEGPTLVVQRAYAWVGWGDARGVALRTLGQDGALAAAKRWDGVAHGTLAISGDYAVWAAQRGEGGPLVARGLADPTERTFADGGSAPALVALDDGFVAAWTEPAGDAWALRGRGLALDGTPRAGAFEVQRAPGPMGAPGVARGGSRLLFAWGDHRSGDAGLHVVGTDLRGGAAGEAQRLSIRYTDASTASVAAAGRGFGVAWSEPVGGAAPRSYLARVDARGRRLGSAMRVAVEDDSGLAQPWLRWERAGYVLALSRADGSLDLRRTGPLGCDAPLE